MKGRHWKFGFIAVVLLTVILASGCVSRQEYDKVTTDLASTQEKLGQTTEQLQKATEELASKESKLSSLDSSYQVLNEDYTLLKDQLDMLESKYVAAKKEYDSLLSDYNGLIKEHETTLEELDESLKPPYVTIAGRQISFVWKDTQDRLNSWVLPWDIYQMWADLEKPDETMTLKGDNDIYAVAMDFRPFVRTEGLDQVIPGVYERCTDELAFAKEMFNLVSQLTEYADEAGEVPRWPFETLTEGGGDCEDLSILFASLLKASPYPYKVSLVYTDLRHRDAPQEANHVLVQVATDEWSVFAECTSSEGWDLFKDIKGWFVEV